MRSNRHRKRGAILLTTVILATAVALALGTFIALAVQSARYADRTFHLNSTLNLAEAGLEKGLQSLNNNDWSGWTDSGPSTKTITLPAFDLGGGVSGIAKVAAFDVNSSPTPRIVAEGSVAGLLGSTVRKQLEVRLSRRSRFATGLVARDTITFSGGNAMVDSYISSDPNFSTNNQYDAAKRRDRGTVASAMVESTSDGVSLGNGDVWGFVATGGSAVDAGPNGTVRGSDTPVGVDMDPNRITKDFSANFTTVAAPSSGFDTILGAVSGDATIGAASTTSLVQAASLTNTNGKAIEIVGDVTLVVTGTIDIKGELIVRPDSSLTVYVGGDVDIGGNGAVNETNVPKNLIIYGTGAVEGSQDIFLHGNGQLVAAVYAPNAILELKGGGNSGQMSGSAIAYRVKMTGNYEFHYDEDLADESNGTPFAVSLWRELFGAAEMVSF